MIDGRRHRFLKLYFTHFSIPQIEVSAIFMQRFPAN
jgi:hypothetical protein